MARATIRRRSLASRRRSPDPSPQSRKGHAVRSASRGSAGRDFTHALLLDGDMQHLPSEAPLLLEAAARTGADVVLGERRFDGEDAGLALSGESHRQPGAVVVHWHAFFRTRSAGYRVVPGSALDGLAVARGAATRSKRDVVKLARRGAQ